MGTPYFGGVESKTEPHSFLCNRQQNKVNYVRIILHLITSVQSISYVYYRVAYPGIFFFP